MNFTLYRHELFDKINEYKGYYDEVLPTTFDGDYYEKITDGVVKYAETFFDDIDTNK